MTPEERAQLLEEMRALEQEHLAVTTAAQVLKGESEALDKLLRGIIPMEEILKAIETEQRKGWKRSPGNHLTGMERQELQNTIDLAMREVMKQLKEAQRARDELQRNK